MVENLYQAYSYSYPHKSAYRKIEPIDLQEIWNNEVSQPLFYYVHLPFCEMRCGFCNLFTVANPKLSVDNYLDALEREMIAYKKALNNYSISNFAIGGGTPTFLTAEQLERLFVMMNDFGVNPKEFYGSIETSPKTLTPEKLALIEQTDIARVSMGIQSWLQEEVYALGRPQDIATTEQAVKMLSQSSVAEFNLDLIYGVQGQTPQSFQYSVEKTIDYQPVEIFLYPLYVRQLTGLGKKAIEASDKRKDIYLHARDILFKNGYEQTSMRCFRKPTKIRHKQLHRSAIDHSIGMGAGARSYTSNLHYSSKYAVSRKEIVSIIDRYSQAEFGSISHGIYLSIEEQKRRFMIKSLIDGGQLNLEYYQQKFNTDVYEDFPFVEELIQKKWLEKQGNVYGLTLEGMRYEDILGVQFYSAEVKEKMATYEWK